MVDFCHMYLNHSKKKNYVRWLFWLRPTWTNTSPPFCWVPREPSPALPRADQSVPFSHIQSCPEVSPGFFSPALPEWHMGTQKKYLYAWAVAVTSGQCAPHHPSAPPLGPTGISGVSACPHRLWRARMLSQAWRLPIFTDQPYLHLGGDLLPKLQTANGKALPFQIPS